MRQTSLLPVALLLLTSATLAQKTVNDNWLPNQGFEEVDAKTNQPAGWHINTLPKAATVSLDKKIFRSGKQSLRIHFDTSKGRPNKSGHGVLIYNFAPSRFVTGRTYTVSGYVKAQGMGQRGWARFDVYQYPAPFPPGACVKSKRLRGDFDWTRIVMTFKARKKIANVMVRALAYGYDGTTDGNVWFDDFKVEEGPKATAYVDTVDTEFYKFFGPSPDHFPVTYDYRASTDIVTPHAEPARGPTPRPLSVLLVAHTNYMRWPAEIAQRTDISVDSCAVNGRLSGYIRHIAHECIVVLRERLKRNPKVIVMNSDTWELLITRDQKDLLDRVRRGAGLVLFDLTRTPAPLVKKTMPGAELLTGPDGKPVRFSRWMSAYNLGKGRIVILPRSAAKKTNTFLREHLADEMVRAIYAAGGVEVARVTITPSTPLIRAGEPWKVTCASSAPAAKWRLKLRPIRKTTSYTVSSEPIEVIQEQTLPAGAEVTAPMPGLAAGSYMVEATALDKAGPAQGWAMRAVPCDGPVNIWTIENSDGQINEDGALRATVAIECGRAAPPSLSLVAEARDTNGRMLAVGKPQPIRLKPGMNRVLVTLTIPATTTPQVRLRVTLRKGDTLFAEEEQRFSGEALLREPDYRFGFYNEYGPGLVSLGADTAVSRVHEATDLGFRLYPWLDVIPYGRTAGALRAEDVITSPETRQRLSAAVQNYLRDIKPFRTVAAIAIDEWEFKRLRKEDEASNLAFFRKYLRDVYGGISGLNAAWQTQLKSFDDVTFALCDPDYVTHDGAPAVRWADLQAMKEAAVGSFLQTIVKAGREVDPDFRLGLSGTRDTRGDNGLDWWELMKHQGSVASYSGLQLRLQESFARPGTRLYRWSYVSKDNIPRGMFDPWWWLFCGHDGYLHYGGRHSDLFKPCYAPHPAAETVREMIAAIRRGPACLLRGAVREDNGVGLLFSPANYRVPFVRRFLGKRSVGVNDVCLSFDRALADAGLDNRWYSYEQLADGLVSAPRVRAFFLPQAAAMSDAEVEAVRSFVGKGGVVIADTRPATYDERLRRRKAAGLNDVFGIRQMGKGIAYTKATAETNGATRLAASAGEWDLSLTDGAVAQGRIKGEKEPGPAVVVHPFGKGTAILLNFAVNTYARYRAGGIGGEVGKESGTATSGSLCPLLAKLLADHASLAPPARVGDAKGKPLPQSRVFTYRDGRVRYIGYIQHYGRKDDPLLTTAAKLHLAERGHLYDVLNHRDLGEKATCNIEVKEAEARLFALMPYKVNDVTVTATSRVARGGFVEIDAQVRGATERHAFLVEIAGPDGVVRAWNRFTIDGRRGAARDRCHIALNAPTGQWSLTVTEVVSGKTAKAPFTVTEGETR